MQVVDSEVTFTEHLPVALGNTLSRCYLFLIKPLGAAWCFHFTDETVEAHRDCYLPKILQLGSDRAWTPSPSKLVCLLDHATYTCRFSDVSVYSVPLKLLVSKGNIFHWIKMSKTWQACC